MVHVIESNQEVYLIFHPVYLCKIKTVSKVHKSQVCYNSVHSGARKHTIKQENVR